MTPEEKTEGLKRKKPRKSGAFFWKVVEAASNAVTLIKY